MAGYQFVYFCSALLGLIACLQGNLALLALLDLIDVAVILPHLRPEPINLLFLCLLFLSHFGISHQEILINTSAVDTFFFKQREKEKLDFKNICKSVDVA